MRLSRLFNQKVELLFVLLFFTSNWIIGQSIAETYSQSQAPGRLAAIEETSSGFEVLLTSDSNLSTPTYLNVDASGNFLSVNSLPTINNASYGVLDNGNFLQRNANTNGPNAEYRLYNQNQGLISTFTIPAPSGALGLGGGALGEYSNGDLLMNFGYSGVTDSDFSILRVNPYSGQIIWRQEIEFGWTNGDGFALDLAITNDNESAFISVANTTNNLYFIVKMSATGTILLNEFFGTTSKIPRNFTASADGGLWYLANALESFIYKKNADGTELIILTDPFLMAGTSNQELVATPDGGVIAMGKTSDGAYTLRLSADGTVLNSTVLDNLPFQVDLFTAGTRLNSGGYIFGGETSSDEDFLLTVDQNGEFVTGGGVCNVSITSSNGGVTITGLTSDANSKLFDANYSIVWQGCNIWETPCTNNESVSGLTVGATYFLSVESTVCAEWIPIVIQGGGNTPTCNDGIQNQGETGVDCGGPCAPCPSGCNVNITSSNGGVTITGLTSDANAKLFNSDVDLIYWGCNQWQGSPCSSNETVSNLIVGATYFLSVQSASCNEWIPIVIQGDGGCSDIDNDGTCDADDCAPANSNLPANPGTACNDNNSNTTNDQIQSDGCTCQGTPVSSGCNVNTSSSGGALTITGLTSDSNTKLFTPSYQIVWECNPWNGSPCSSNETVSGLTVGATYFLSVQSSVCNEWIPIVIQGGGGGNGPDLTISAQSIFQGIAGELTSFNFEVNNQGDTDVTGSYFIKYYISTDAALSSNDIEVGSMQTGNTPVGVTNFTRGFIVPNVATGNYFLILEVDATSTIAESNENNNIGASSFAITTSGGNGPDLTTNSLTTGIGTAGSVLGFTFNLVNQGNATATGDYFIRSYVSTDATLSSDDIQDGVIVTGNTAIGSTGVVGAITVPNVPEGTYYLILVVDDGNSIVESNENNNVESTAFFLDNNNGGNGICDNVSNVAQGKPTNQSSTVSAGGVTGNSSKAVDGNTNGNFFSGSVAATNDESQAWWQVDLGGFYQVETIEVFNRTEGSARLNDFYILTADLPFTANDLATARNQASNEQYYAGQAGTPTTWNFPNGDLVRYVRIQRASQGYVTLAEVRVNGCPPGGMPENTFYELGSQNEGTAPIKLTNLFPNPTTGELITQIESKTDGEASIQIVNMLGQLKLERKMDLEIGTNTLQLQLDQYEDGIYHIIFNDGKKQVSKQFVISKSL